MSAPPLPPLNLRVKVGPTADFWFDNPTGGLVFPELPPETYDAVFDWGCGCGRLARQLIQQRPAPRRYVGVDLQRDAIKWCRDNLTPHAPQFRFHHQNVYNLGFNPKASAARLPFPVEDDFATLVLAWSVFTHTLEENVAFYLGEVARILRPEGVALTTWMLFDKSDFPMMQDFQNALYINLVDPTNATIFDKRWLRDTARRAGLVLTRIDPPGIRGDACRVFMRLAGSGAGEAPFPPEPPPCPAPAP